VGHWDHTIRGSSALRAAIIREVRSDLAKKVGMQVATMLWDWATFFDSLEPWLIGPTGQLPGNGGVRVCVPYKLCRRHCVQKSQSSRTAIEP
jgi:hypothetical protein